MRTTKKITAALLAAILALSVSACGSVHQYSKGLDENGFFEGVKASEIVTLPEYKGLDIDSGIPVASDDEVQKEIDDILSYYGAYEKVTDREVVDGDTLNIDYVGSIDGVAFSGGNTNGQGTEVTIGVTNYIEGFLDQLIGHLPGETFDINVTFPENYGKEDLNGKDAVFKVTINYIRGEYIEPELTDEIAADYGYESVDSLVEYIKKWRVSNDKFVFMTEILSEAICDEVPESVIDYLANYELSYIKTQAAYSGYTLEQYMMLMGYDSSDAYVEANLENYKRDAAIYIAVQAIAETENIVVTDADIEAAGYTDEVKEYGKPYIKQYMLCQEIIPQFIIDNGNLVDGLTEAE